MNAVLLQDERRAEDQVDKSLVAAFVRGDRTALSELYRRHARRVESIARHVMGPSDETEDVVQDVFIELQRALPRFRGESRFTTWLHRVVVNVSLQRLRKRKRKGWGRWVSIDKVPHQLPSHRSPEHQAQARQSVEVIYAALDKISDKKRAVFVLYEFEGLSLQEIATTVDTSVNTVKSRLFHARREVFEHVRQRGLLPTHMLEVVK